ncbi:MAG: site-2 protease family protein [Nitrospiraceae bacterium]
MQPHVRLGRIFGIDIGLHYSWLIIAFLITLSFASEFQLEYPQWGSSVIWSAAIVTGILFFSSILIHEMGHALVAQVRGLPVRTITLFALGGVALTEKDAGDPKTEFWMGIAGPLTSVGIGLLCVGSAGLLGGKLYPNVVGSPVVAVLDWVGSLNFLLAAFNMIPGFPLDGGRVLRAVIWWATDHVDRATRIAARIGQGSALFLIVFGLWQSFTLEGIGSLWLALVGWFLLEAATASYAQVEAVAGLRGLRVRDIMANDCASVAANTSLQTFADEYLLRTGHRCFVVKNKGEITGLITPTDLKQVDRAGWSTTQVHVIMRPLDRLRTVSPDTPVIDALQTMGRADVNQLPVVLNGHMEGFLTRSDIVHVLQARAELSM